MSRLKDIALEDMNPEQKQVAEEIITGPRGHLVGPLKVWVNNPKLADRAQRLGQYARFDSNLPPRLSELAILVTGRYWSAEFEWFAHKKIALHAGISPEAVQAIRDRKPPKFDKADEQAVYDFAHSLHHHKTVSDAVYKQAVDALGENAVIDLVAVCGYYTLISMTLNAFKVGIPDGVEEEMTE